ncbi:hypothetical protein BU16DRAFT_543134 [Lophium mytilinum]|uniref:MYND-type domain-containing protein n=1 Tax=Lophium mytilinum TaxID=390894 RepID=A0A6A6QFN5_9PEZI|nr:hypothetical protein BU16DRAFT_543134 [Lophium mytilinum]
MASPPLTNSDPDLDTKAVDQIVTEQDLCAHSILLSRLTLSNKDAAVKPNEESSIHEAHDNGLLSDSNGLHNLPASQSVHPNQGREQQCSHPRKLCGVCLSCFADSYVPSTQTHPIDFIQGDSLETVDEGSHPHSASLRGITPDGPYPPGFDPKSLTRAEAYELADIRFGRLLRELTEDACREAWTNPANGRVDPLMTIEMTRELLREGIVDGSLGVEVEDDPARELPEEERSAEAPSAAEEPERFDPLSEVDKQRLRELEELERAGGIAEPEIREMMYLRVRDLKDCLFPADYAPEYPPQPTSSEISAVPTIHCPTCCKVKPLRACTGCKRIAYCSTKCQRADWSRHKHYCCSARAGEKENVPVEGIE